MVIVDRDEVEKSVDIDDEACLPKSLLQELGRLGLILDDQNFHESDPKT